MSASMPPPLPPQPRRVFRSDNRVIAGVCGGFAEYFGVDPTLIRVLAVVTGLMFCPVVPIGYLVAWAIVPKH